MIAALAVTMFLAQAKVEAAPAQAEAPLLTLDQALKEARDRNLDIQAAQAKLGQAKQTAAKVWALYLPQLSVGASITRNAYAIDISLPAGYSIRNVCPPQAPNCGATTSVNEYNDPSHIDPENLDLDHPPGGPTSYLMFPASFQTLTVQPLVSLGAQASLSQAIIAPALWAGIHNAYLGEEVATLTVDNAKREILFAVAQLYYGAAGLKEAVKIQRRLLEINTKHEADAKVRYQAGTVPKAALLRAEIDRTKAEQDVKRAENAYLSAKIALATLLDKDGEFSVDVPNEPTLPPDLAGMEESAMQNRPDVTAARKSVDLAEGLKTGSYLKYLPNVGLTANWRIANSAGFGTRNDSWAIGLGLNWNLFDGGAREAEIRENGYKVVEAQANERNAVRRAKDDVARARLDLDSAVANRSKAAEQLKLARENSQIVSVSYQSGAATYLEVEDANAALLASELGAVGENLNAQLAGLKLLKAAGQFNP